MSWRVSSVLASTTMARLIFSFLFFLPSLLVALGLLLGRSWLDVNTNRAQGLKNDKS
jgi:hypothetical protein